MTRSQKYYRKLKIKPGEQSHFTGRGTCNALRTMEEVARILGISRQAVHQAERSAFHKIRTALMPELEEMNRQLAENV